MNNSLARVSNTVLLDQLKCLVQREREATAALVAHLAEIKRRRLYLGEGYSSMFRYCTQVLHLSEHATYLRLEAAKLALRFPAILVSLENGDANLTAIRLLAPHLTSENFVELLAAARHRTRVEIEYFLARRFPRADVPTVVRKLPVRAKPEGTTMPVEPAGAAAPAPPTAPVEATSARSRPDMPASRPVIEPLAPERYKVQFTASVELHDKLRRAQDLLRHRIPNGDLSQVFELALAALVEKLEKQKLAATDRPRASRTVAPDSRRIPAEVKRAVWKRDGERCAFVGMNGRRCSETGFLEFHHVMPFARGGEATTANIQLRCRAHNQFEAMLDFGSCERAPGSPWGDDVVRESSAAWSCASRDFDAKTIV